MKIVLSVLLFQGVISQMIKVTPNTTTIDVLEGRNITIKYQIEPRLSEEWAVLMNLKLGPNEDPPNSKVGPNKGFDNFFTFRYGNNYTEPKQDCICNVTYNHKTSTFTLRLYNVTTKDHNSTYEFVLQNTQDGNNKTSPGINVHVREMPKLSTANVSGLEFHDVTLNCSIDTTWVNKIWWTSINGSTINSCEKFNDHKSQLCQAVLNNATRTSRGVYTCHAEKLPHYNISKNISLDIFYGPQHSSFELLNITSWKSITSSFNVNVTEGDVLNVSCTTDCNPDCNYTWSLNEGTNYYLDIESPNSNLVQKSTGSYLVVNATRKTERFTCTVENQHGRDNVSVKVNVLYSSEITNITTLDGETTVNETDDVTVTCSAEGNPKPSIRWSKNGEPIKSNNTDQWSNKEHSLKSEDSNTGYFFFQDRGCYGTGNYTCTSYNGIGNNSKTISILVNCKPKILEPKEKTVKVFENSKSLRVCYIGYPAPEVTLQFNGTDSYGTDMSKSNIFSKNKSNEYTTCVIVLLNGTRSWVKNGYYRIKLWNYYGNDHLDVELISHNQHGHGGLEMITVVAYVCFIIGICVLVGCLYRRKMQNKNQAAEERSTGIQLRVQRGYDGSYRDNSLYVSCSPNLRDNRRNNNFTTTTTTTARDTGNQRPESTGTPVSEGGYRDNSLYAPCTSRMLQKLNSAKKRNVKESETTENVKKKADQCHNGSDVNPYSYVNFFVDFAAKGEETKVGNHKLKEDEQSQGTDRYEDKQGKKFKAKGKTMRMVEQDNLLDNRSDYKEEGETESYNMTDENYLETDVPIIPPKTALAFQTDSDI